MLLWPPWRQHASCGNGTISHGSGGACCIYCNTQVVRPRLVISWAYRRLGRRQIKGKRAVSWTLEFGRETPRDGRWDIMTVHSEAEAVRQAKEYLDIGFVVNAIKRPDGSIAHDQDQLNALYHGFDDLALKLAERRNRSREATEANPPPDTAATEFARSGGLEGGRARAAALNAAKRRWSQKGGSQD